MAGGGISPPVVLRGGPDPLPSLAESLKMNDHSSEINLTGAKLVLFVFSKSTARVFITFSNTTALIAVLNLIMLLILSLIIDKLATKM